MTDGGKLEEQTEVRSDEETRTNRFRSALVSGSNGTPPTASAQSTLLLFYHRPKKTAEMFSLPFFSKVGATSVEAN